MKQNRRLERLWQSHVKEHTCLTALEARPYTVNSCCKSVCFCKEPHTVLFVKSPQKSTCYQTEGTQTIHYIQKEMKLLCRKHTFVQRAKKRDMWRWASEINITGLLLAEFCWFSSSTTVISISVSPSPKCWSPLAPCVVLILSISIGSLCPASVGLKSTTARRLWVANSSIVSAT